MVEGRAVQVTDNDTLRRLAEAWVMKWDGRCQQELKSAPVSGTEECTTAPAENQAT